MLSATGMAMAPLPASAACKPPPNFVDTLPPIVAPMRALISHREQIVIDRPLAHVLAVARATPLADAIDRKSALPSVSGTYPLTPGAFGKTGSRRLTCLTDGSTLEEQVLASRETANAALFRYVVWNYSTAKARPTLYGVGQFLHVQLADGRTAERWTYGFALRRSRFPGILGSFGDYLFRVRFLERDYATMMRNSLATGKLRAEQTPIRY